MKRTLLATMGLALVTPQPSFGQNTAQPTPMIGMADSPPKPSFTRFDLDFPGGTPRDLVVAIEEASGKPLNAVIPTEHAVVKLPPLKMRNVTAPQLFEAMIEASLKTVPYETGTYMGQGGQGYRSIQQYRESHGFRAPSAGEGDNTIWYFHFDKYSPPELRSICRYYQLAPYLNGYTIDDITTAVQTGWRMLGEKDTPQLNFHEETKLLIAVGREDDLALIDQVLAELRGVPRAPPVPPAAGSSPMPLLPPRGLRVPEGDPPTPAPPVRPQPGASN